MTDNFATPVYEKARVEDLGSLADLTRGDAGATPDITIAGSE